MMEEDFNVKKDAKTGPSSTERAVKENLEVLERSGCDDRYMRIFGWKD